MTAVEMKYKFDMKLRDLLGALNHPFTTQEINRFLNEAQLDICQQYADKFEIDENARQVLSVYVKPFIHTTFTTDAYSNVNGVYAETIPANLLTVVNELVNDTVRVKPITHDEYAIATRNPFKAPYSELVWRMDRNDQRELITDGTLVITKYSGDYLVLPDDIDIDNGIDCKLTHQVHENILERGIEIALTVIKRTLSLTGNDKGSKEK
jgi:hypothetical protein